MPISIALKECRPPWPKYSCIAKCIICMKGCEAAKQQQCYCALYCLGGERLIPKGLDLYLHHNLVMLQLLSFLLIYSS